MSEATYPTVLLVDDEANLLAGLKRHLRRNFEVLTALNGQDAIDVARNHAGDISVIVCDMRMPGMDGAQTLRELSEIKPDATRVMLTGNSDQLTAVRAVNEGNVYRFLTKPFATDKLLSILRDSVAKHAEKIADRAMSKKLSVSEEHLKKERELNRLQKNFISMISHEVKTPVAIIDGAAQLLMRRANLTDEQVEKRVSQIRTGVQRINDVLKSALDFTRMDTGNVATNLTDTDLVELATGISERYERMNEAARVKVIDDAGGAVIRTDPSLLETVLSNLIGNAIKYSPDNPFVMVRLVRTDDRVEISIEDRGMGIPEEEIPHLFDRFFRASNATGISGTGIGLHLVRAFTERLGGMVDVSSHLGEGTVFTVKLPVEHGNEMEGGMK